MRAHTHARRRRTACAEFTLPYHRRSARWARKLTGTFLDGVPHSPALSAAEAQLVVSELVANATEHGTGPCRLRLRIAAGTLTVEVHDDSPLRPQGGMAGPDSERGRGIALVRLLTQEFRVTSAPGRGKTVRTVLAVA